MDESAATDPREAPVRPLPFLLALVLSSGPAARLAPERRGPIRHVIQTGPARHIMTRPKLIALDLDGTLLPASKRLSERSRRALATMASHGTLVTLATGKFLHLAHRYSEELALRTPIIALDGARVGGNGSGVVERCIARETVLDLLERFDDVSFQVFADDGADEMLLRSTSAELPLILRPWAERIREVDDLRPHLVGDPAILTFYGPDSVMAEMDAESRATNPELRTFRFEVPPLGQTRLSFQPGGVSKGSGLEELLDDLDLCPSECMVFGDWHNDLHMFALGCHNVAMANAVPEVKAAADTVLELSCEQDGVADFLEMSFL